MWNRIIDTMAQKSASDTDSELTVVDADAHVQETLDAIKDHMEEGPAKDLIYSSPIPMSEVYGLDTGTPTYVYKSQAPEKREKHILDDAIALSEVIRLREELGVGPLVITPTINLLLPAVNNDQFAVKIADAYNKWIVDEIEAEGLPDTYFNILVPPQRPQKGAEQIEKWADNPNSKGVCMPLTGLYPPAGHRIHDPIYEAAEKHGLPVCFHSGGGAWNFPLAHRWTETYAEGSTWLHPTQHMTQMVSLMYNGVPERYPDLNFVHQEAGIGWVPYLMYRMDDHYLEFSYEIPALDKLPSEYIKDQFYFTTQPLGHTPSASDYIATCIESIGTDRVMFSGDLPHADFDTPEELSDRLRRFDDDTVADIMGGTARKVFDL